MKTTEQKPFKPNKEFVIKLLDTIKPGLCKGVGNPVPGEMCIIAAFNNTLGRKHGDSGLEDCVGSAVRSFDIRLNDCNWSSNEARAKGMRREAVAKIGSNQITCCAFWLILLSRH